MEIEFDKEKLSLEEATEIIKKINNIYPIILFPSNSLKDTYAVHIENIDIEYRRFNKHPAQIYEEQLWNYDQIQIYAE